ncbi:MAG: YdeI/OmpD-associated family protein [Vicinamibacteria bacterium]|nr:YdeI/OmpD-associated family protein [Vicinamibacteria bacterium]
MTETPTAYATPAAFRSWLKQNHARRPELLVRCFKVHAAERGITYVQALDEALCFGWIDGVRRSLDSDSFSVRFTPRKAKSYWSAVNIAKAEALIETGRMAPPGQAAFNARDQAPPRKYSFESKPEGFAPGYLKKIRANARASAHYDSRPPGYIRTHAFWVMSAVNEATRLRRLETLIQSWERGEAAPPLKRRNP